MDKNFTFLSWYHEVFYEKADLLIRDKPLMGNPLPITLIYIFYVILFVCVLPKFMQNRKSIDCKKFSDVLDAIVLVISLYFLAVASYGWFWIFNWHCQPIHTGQLSRDELQARYCWEYLMTRFIFTFQSVPFVMRKRKSSHSDYIIAHHSIFPLMVWSIINYFPGGHATFVGFINSIVLSAMLIYHLMIIHWPQLKQYRKIVYISCVTFEHLTCLIHTLQFFFWKNCNVPTILPILVIAYASLLTFLYYFLVIHAKVVKIMNKSSDCCEVV